MKTVLFVLLLAMSVWSTPHRRHHKKHAAKRRMAKTRKGMFMQEMEYGQPQQTASPLALEFGQVIQHLEGIIGSQTADLESFGALCKEILVLKHKVHKTMAHQAQMVLMNQEILQQILASREELSGQSGYILDRQYIAEGHVFDQTELCHRYSTRARIAQDSIRPLMGRELVMRECPQTVLSYMRYNMAYYWPMYNCPVYQSVQQMASPYLALSGATLFQDAPTPQPFMQQYSQLSQPQPQSQQDAVTNEIDQSSVEQLDQEKNKLKVMLEQDQQEQQEDEQKKEEQSLLGQIRDEDSLASVQKDLNDQLKEQPPLDSHSSKLHNEEDSHGHPKDSIELDPFQTQMQNQVHQQQMQQEQEMLNHPRTPHYDSSNMPGYEVCQESDLDYEACEDFIDSDDKMKKRRKAAETDGKNENNDLQEQNRELAREQEQFNEQNRGQEQSNEQKETNIGQEQYESRFRKITQKQVEEIHKIYDSGKSVLEKALAVAAKYKEETPKRRLKRKSKKKKKENQKHRKILAQIRQNL